MQVNWTFLWCFRYFTFCTENTYPHFLFIYDRNTRVWSIFNSLLFHGCSLQKSCFLAAQWQFFSHYVNRQMCFDSFANVLKYFPVRVRNRKKLLHYIVMCFSKPFTYTRILFVILHIAATVCHYFHFFQIVLFHGIIH